MITGQCLVLQDRLVTFNIQVANQGTVAASNVEITDYVPAEFTLEDSNWTYNAGTGNATYNNLLTIAAGAVETIQVTFRVNTGVTGQVINRAEISDADDAAGADAIDIDSTPNDDVNDDNGGVVNTADDNNTSGNGTLGEDEDDADPEDIFVETFDIALRKTLNTTLSESPLVQNRTVVFDIEVFNQGTVNATGIQIADYIPAELTLNDPAWSAAGGIATYSSSLNILAGGSETITIAFTINEGVTGTVSNFAEVAAANDGDGDPANDIDSTPNSNNTDDGTPVNDEINNGGGDEDDHDIETFTVETFDLALRKTTLETDVVIAGEDILFTIEIFNQGTIAATNVGVIDYIPAGFVLSPNDTNGWASAGGNNVSLTINETIAPGTSVTRDIVLMVNTDISAGTYINTSEITGATDTDGDAADDIDSTPNTNPSDDNLVDNLINDDGDIDEDDHDVEPNINVCDIIPPVISDVPPNVTIDCNDAIPAEPTLYTEITVTDESDPNNIIFELETVSTQGTGDDCSDATSLAR